MSPTEKSRALKEKSILEAVGKIFLRDGYRQLGINTIAAEAGCSKVLVYRYFGGMEGLLAAFAEQFKVHIVPEKKANSEQGMAKELFNDQITRLRSSPILREIMKWELVDTNPLTSTLAAQREEVGLEILKQFEDIQGVDLPALASVLSAGVSYLALRADTAQEFCGIDITSDEGWERIANMLDSLMVDVIHKGDEK